jgi:hypothetical protein
MLASGIELWKFYFQIRAPCAMTSAFDKIAGTKKLQANACFCSQTLFCRQMLFLQATLFIGKNSQQ